MAIKISGTTVIDDSRNLVNINSGLGVGIQSAGTAIGTGITQLNFVGSGNTFAVNGTTVDINIQGSGGGGLGTAINYTDGTASPFSYIDRYATVAEDMLLDTTTAGVSTSFVVSVTPNIEISSGVAVTVGAGKTMVIDILQIGDL